MQKITLIVAHSASLMRRRLASSLSARSEIELLAQTRDLMETYSEVEDLEPMAVLIEEKLAQKAEFEVMRALFSALDVRWLVVTDRARMTQGNTSPWDQKSDLFSMESDSPPDVIAEALGSLTRTARRNVRTRAPAAPPSPVATGSNGTERFILIGASTGGVDALITVLSSFPANCPPTFIVQHTGGGFGESLTRLLDRQCAATVRPARDGDTVGPGEVVVAAGSRAHLVLTGGKPMRTALRPGAPVTGHMPSVDAMFQSAVPGAGRAVAALLTGMGRDGAEGLKALRDNGAVTFAQDEASCVVYGMPRAAALLDAADSVLPLNRIGPALLRASTKPASRTTRRAGVQ